MSPLPWKLVALAWGYAIVWIPALDQVKLLAHMVLEHCGEAASAVSDR